MPFGLPRGEPLWGRAHQLADEARVEDHDEVLPPAEPHHVSVAPAAGLHEAVSLEG